MLLVGSENYRSMTILTYLKKEFGIRTITVAFVYKSQESLVTSIVNLLLWLADVKKVDIVLGDFIIGALCNAAYAAVDNMLREYVLMVTEPIQLNGGLLDYLYLQKQYLIGKQANSKLSNIYLSEYDILKTHNQKEEKLEDNK